jgi:putative ABC transport system ATP-binding protein
LQASLGRKIIETCWRVFRKVRFSFEALFPMIELHKITKTVRSGVEDLTILSDVSLSIPRGQFVALTGASGSGKSTLLGLIAGLDSPSSGQIRVDGEEITSMGEDGLARIRSEKIGFVFQSFHLIPSLTAFENVLIPMEIVGAVDARSRAAELLESVGLTDRGHHYPNELSGGEQQRVAIARAFANEPRILLADEPTGNLDSRNGQHIFELMEELHTTRNITLVLVTHDATLANKAERQIVLRDGCVVNDSKHE